MIANGTDIGSFIPTINFKVGNSRLLDFIKTAQADLAEKVLGSTIESELEQPIDDSEIDRHAELRTMVKRAIYLSAFFDSIPELDLQLSEAGFVVASNSAVSPASRERVGALMQRVSERRSDAVDKLHRFLIENSKDDGSKYAEWRSSTQFAHLGSGFVLSLGEFNDCFVANDDSSKAVLWDDFYRLIPRMNDALYGEIAQYVSSDYITELLEKKFDSESILSLERSVSFKISCAVVAAATGNTGVMRTQAVRARNIMVDNISLFPTFRASSSYVLPRMEIGSRDDAVVNML